MTEILAIAEDVASRLDQLDRAVDEVFTMMAGISCVPTESLVEYSHEVTSIIGLAGSLSGAFVVSVTEADAICITEALTRSQITEFDSMVSDTMGEICNMLAGVWKGGFRNLASACLLSVPTVFTGKDYRRCMQSMLVCIERSYLFESHAITVSILYEPSPK